MKSVIFTNWTEQDFTWTWDSVSYTFKARTNTYIEDWKAAHFAKHLVDRELLLQNKLTSDQTRQSLLKKCIQTDDTSEDTVPEKLNTELLNKNQKKTGRPKKEVPVSTTEEVFEGLK